MEVKQSRIQLYKRWSLWVITIVLNVIVVVSLYEEIRVLRSQSINYHSLIVIDKSRLKLNFTRYGQAIGNPTKGNAPTGGSQGIPNFGPPVPMFKCGYPLIVPRELGWWEIPDMKTVSTLGNVQNRPFTRYAVDFPLAYVSLLLSGLSLWILYVLAVNRAIDRALEAGDCSGCGYSLVELSGNQCPQCGETHEA